MRGVAVIGNIALDTIAGGRPRVGGAPYHAARALRLLGGGSRIVARSAESDRRALVAPLAALGVQWTWLAAPSTTTFEIRYHGEEREMSIGDPGSPWTLEDARAVGRAEWVQVGGLTRADFPPDVLAALARDRRLALDGQALVRRADTGPLVLDADFDPAVLRHLTALKLNEEEVAALGGEERGHRARRPRAAAHARLDRGAADQPRRPRADPRAAHRHRQPDGRRRCLPRRLRLGARGRPPPRLGRAPRGHDGRTRARADRGAGRVIALVRTVDGVFRVDVETEVVFGEVDETVDHEQVELELPRVVAASAAGATVVAVVDRRPPLVVSYDAGLTWNEAGGGLPPGFDVAVDPADPDRILFAARNRLHLSTDGGRFWRSLAPELPDVEAVAWEARLAP